MLCVFLIMCTHAQSYTFSLVSNVRKEVPENIYAGIIAHIVPISLRQSASVYIDNDTILMSYKVVLAKLWKLILWNTHARDKDTNQFKQNFGGGIESPLFTFGHYVAQGVYTYFSDITSTTAWDTTIHQYTRWVIRSSPVQKPALGGIVSLPSSRYTSKPMNSHDPIFSIWGGRTPNPYSNAVRDSYSHFGVSLGHTIWNWDTRILYQLSQRNMLPLQSYRWNNWIITSPTALKLHQLMLFQKLKISNFFIADMVVTMSNTDTHTHAFGGKTMMRWFFLNFELAFSLALSQPHAVHDEWKYSKYIWNVSVEFLWFYVAHAHIRLRSEIAEYNLQMALPHRLYTIKRMYYAEWRQNFIYDNWQSALESVLGYDYMYAQDYEHHKSKVDITFTHGLWTRKKPPITIEDAHRQGARVVLPEITPTRVGEFDYRVLNVIKYHIDDMSRALKKIDMASTVSSKMKLSEAPVSFWISYKMNMVFDIIKNDVPVDAPWNSALKDITSSVGSHIRIQGIYIPIQVMCVVEFHDENLQEDTHTVHWKFKFKIQYNW